MTVVKIGGSLSADPDRLRAHLRDIADGRHGSCVVVPGGGAFADAVRERQAREGFDDATAHRLALDAMGRMAARLRAMEPRLVGTENPWVDACFPRPSAGLQLHATPDRFETRSVFPGLAEGENPEPITAALAGRDEGDPPHSASAAAMGSGFRFAAPERRGSACRSVNAQASAGENLENGAPGPEASLPAPDPPHGPPSPAEGGGKAAGAIWDPISLRAGHPDIPETWDVTSDSLALWLAAQLRAWRCILVKSADAPHGFEAAALARLGLVDAAFPAFAARFTGAIELWGPSGPVTLPRRAAA